MDAFISGISLILVPSTLILIFIGVLIGVLVGALPGLSSPMAVALLIPFTISMDPVPAIAMMSALYCAGTYGGSITAILINTPGAPPATATAFDGYPMAKKGEAGRALGLATMGSCIGGIFSLFVFIALTPLLAKVAVKFGPVEYFALTLFAISMLASLSGKSSLRNLIIGLFGVLIGTIGMHITTGIERFTFGFTKLSDGIDFVPVLIGLFAVSELFSQSHKVNDIVKKFYAKALKLPSLKEIIKHKYLILRSSIIGTYIGILPAEGSTVAAIMGYNEAKRFSKNPELFGKGSPEGILGPETANNAATGGAMVPTLALGIPGSGTTAVILAALIVHGIRPGPIFLKEQPEFVYSIFGAMFIANFAFLLIGLVGAKAFATVTFIPKKILWPSVFIFAMVGAYCTSSSLLDVWVMLFSGVLGYFMNRHGFGPAPLLMGLILGKMLEETFSQSMIIRDNSFISFFDSPIACFFFILTFISLASPFWSTIKKKIFKK